MLVFISFSSFKIPNSMKIDKRGPLDGMITVLKKSHYVQLDKVTLLQACTEMVTVNGRPLTIFNDSGFKKILNPLTQAIGEGIPPNDLLKYVPKLIISCILIEILGFTINSQNIKKHIFCASKTIINEITENIKNSLVSLKIDCVKRHNRSIMGVNIQFIKNMNVCLATLAMREINEQHTAQNLKKMVYLIYINITFYHILSKIVNMNDECEAEAPHIEEDLINFVDSEDNESDDEYTIEDGTLLSTNDIVNQLFNEEVDDHDNLQEIIVAAMEPKSITSCIRCSVHSLQLCVLGGIKSAAISNCIPKAREIVKKLITPKYACWLKRKNLKYAIIDIETRWNSMYNMLYRLLELKEFYLSHEETNPDLHLKNCEWESIQSVNALHPVKTTTLALQKQNLTIGDFYAIWLKSTHGLNANGSILAKKIKSLMDKRIQENYLSNSTFLAAIFVDPRYQCLLTPEQQQIAITRLVETWETLLLLKNRDSPIDEFPEITANDKSTIESTIESSQDSTDPFEDFLSSQASLTSNSSASSLTVTSESILNILNGFKNVERISYTADILQYWKTRQLTDPELYQLASVVLAVPATQVSVERSFSGLKFVVSELSTSLDPELLEAIMLFNKSVKMWSIVIFDDENAVEAVPAHWMKNNLCAWPKKDTKKHLLRRTIPNKFNFNYVKSRLLKKGIDYINKNPLSNLGNRPSTSTKQNFNNDLKIKT
ncbi:hypothetical protein ACI65C_001890 [Semiaphis heraclei]